MVKELADLMGAYEKNNDDTVLRDRVENVRWVTRRLGETMIEDEAADAVAGFDELFCFGETKLLTKLL